MRFSKALAVCGLAVFLFAFGRAPAALGQKAEGGMDAAVSLALRPGKTVQKPSGDVVSTDESVLRVEGDTLVAVASGKCALVVVRNGHTYRYPVTVDDNIPPDEIQKAIEIAQAEWRYWHGHALKKSNKYTLWYCRRPCSFGWCGGFVGWCLDEAGVPMYRVEKAQPVADGQPYAIAEAGVGKILKGYTKMDRLSKIPRPGYLVIYAVRDSVNKTVHVGMVTKAEPMENGRYLITTVEGNVSNTVKSYQYYYDSLDDTQHNMIELPKEEWTGENMSYALHSGDWYINTFCQTYQ